MLIHKTIIRTDKIKQLNWAKDSSKNVYRIIFLGENKVKVAWLSTIVRVQKKKNANISPDNDKINKNERSRVKETESKGNGGNTISQKIFLSLKYNSVFLFSVILLICTHTITHNLRKIRHAF